MINRPQNLIAFKDFDDFYQFGIRGLVGSGTMFLFPLEYPFPNTLTFLNLGIGFGIDLLENIVSPGIYFNLGIGTGWVGIFSGVDADTLAQNPQFGLLGGFRLYNIFSISNFQIIPFWGYNFLFFIEPLAKVGISLSWFLVAIEYAFYYSTRYTSRYITHRNNLHHLTFKIKLNMNLRTLFNELR